jgi:hypothetical protein
VIKTDITPELVIHTAARQTMLSQVTEAMEAWYGHPDFDPQRPVLWDMREAEGTLPDQDQDAWSDYNRSQVNRQRPGCKTAWVFGDPRVAEFAVELLGAHHWQHRVRIFHNDMEAAQAWLTSSIH